MTATTDAERGEPGPRSTSYHSGTPWGRALLRDAAQRQSLVKRTSRSRHGLDLGSFARALGARRTPRVANVGTATLGPMQVDVRLTDALKDYVAEHGSSQRIVLELLLQELLGALPDVQRARPASHAARPRRDDDPVHPQ